MNAERKDEHTLVSIIIPVYNRAGLVNYTLNSAYEQTYRPIELVIINDGSKDQSEEVILNWKREKEDSTFNVQYILQENKGAPAARNLGLKCATGEYIQFLDSDDLLDKSKIEFQVNELKRTGAELAVCDFSYVESNGKIIKTCKNKGNIRLKVARNRSLSIFTSIFHRNLLGRGISWNEKLSKMQDVDFFFNVVMVSKKIIYTPGNWCYYRQHSSDQISATYQTTKPEYLKRAKSLIEFVLKNRKHIKIMYYFLYVICMCFFLKDSIMFNGRILAQKYFPLLIKLRGKRL